MTLSIPTSGNPLQQPWITPSGVSGLVSIVIPTRNRAALVSEALDALLRQTYRPLEIIVVDDGSDDDTQARVYAAQARADDQCDVKYQRQEHAGGPAARNIGAQLCAGEYIAFMDDDDIASMNFVQSRVTALSSTSGANLAYGLWQTFVFADGAFQLLDQRGAFPKGSESKWYGFLNGWDLLLQGCLIRRDLVSRVGPWHTGLHKSQDLDYKARLMAEETCVPVFARGGPVFYRLHTDSISGELDVAKMESYVEVVDRIEEISIQRPDYEDSKQQLADCLWYHAFWLYGKGDFARGYRELRRAKAHSPRICQRKGIAACLLNAVGFDIGIGPGYYFLSRCKRVLGLSKRKVDQLTNQLPTAPPVTESRDTKKQCQ